MYISEATIETNLNSSQKMKNRTTIWSNNFIPGYTSEGIERANLKRYMYPNVHLALFTVAIDGIYQSVHQQMNE